MTTSRDRDFISVVNGIDEQITTLSFKPHITQRLTELEHPKTSLDHEILHTLRESYDDRSSPTTRPVTSNSVDYTLWLEAGKHAHKPTYAKSLDGKPPINYNIWRNYRHYYAGISSHSARRPNTQCRLNDEAAFKYPITIPAPSQLGENHLRQFFEANRKELFRNQSHFRMALVRADNDERMLRMLSLQTQQRNPPVSSDVTEPTPVSNALLSEKPSSASTTRIRQVPPHNSLNVSPQFLLGKRFGSGRKFVMRENHPSIEKLKFEQELKVAVNFHRELKRSKEGNERSLYARHQPV